MAIITSFMLGNATQTFPDDKGIAIQQLVGLTTVLRPNYIPSDFSFAFSLGVRDVDLKEQNTLHMIIKSPSDETVIDFGEVLLQIIDKPDTLPKEFGGFVLSTDVRNMKVLEEGMYHLEININGELVATEEIPVFKGSD